MTESQRIRRAVLSVTDKTGLVDLARALVGRDVELVASGGTAAHLREAGLPVTAVESVTHFPEMLDGRVKTLHPMLHAGLLADRGKPGHRADLERHGITPVDLVVVNFYAFGAAAAREELPIEAIDIGGPTLVRAAAKNHAWVTVLTDPADYAEFLAAWGAGSLDLELRRRLAARAFERIAAYDRSIADVFARATGTAGATLGRAALRHVARLRYGENPHQDADAYATLPATGLGAAQQLSGPELSYNNLVDVDSALDLAFDLGEPPACVIVKHNNPCGVALGDTLPQAYAAALACDPVSAYGGVIALNARVDVDLVDAFGDLFIEVLAAPAFTTAARERLQKRKRARVLEVPRDTWTDAVPRTERALHGLVLSQTPDHGFPELEALQAVTARQPTPAERRDAAFLLAVCKHVRSNAIVVGKNLRTLGIGAGQMSRVDSCELAVRKASAAGLDLHDSVAVSDAFFPFADGVERLAAAGVRVVLQPGGSKRDAEVIAAADRLGMCMLLGARRHFRH
jgi:phosphoribosylaminoimidazolecarboxamide formyltransferase/IMP cyclohydrolase